MKTKEVIKPNYRRINKMTPEELQEMHRKIYNSARVYEDKSKHQKKKERQKKQKGYDDGSFYLHFWSRRVCSQAGKNWLKRFYKNKARPVAALFFLLLTVTES